MAMSETIVFLHRPKKSNHYLFHNIGGIVSAASGLPEVIECRDGDCTNSNFNGESIWCDSKNNGASIPSCLSSTFTDSRVECEAGSCKTSTFLNSEVRCLDTLGANSCDQSSFNQSLVSCYDEACQSSDFYSSALFCSPYYACGSSTAFACSCCDVRHD